MSDGISMAQREIGAFRLDDGGEVWRTFVDAGTTEPDTWVPIWSSAAYAPALGFVYFGTGNTNRPAAGGVGRSRIDAANTNAVMALDHASGEIAWLTRLVEVDEGRDFDIGASPNLFEIDGRPVVGVGSKAGDYGVMDRQTGELLWMVDLTAGSPAGGVVGSGTTHLSSLNPNNLAAGASLRLDQEPLARSRKAHRRVEMLVAEAASLGVGRWESGAPLPYGSERGACISPTGRVGRCQG